MCACLAEKATVKYTVDKSVNNFLVSVIIIVVNFSYRIPE